MDWMRMLSLKTRPTFSLLVVLLGVFSVGAWWSVSSLIWSEIRSRLDSHADRITAAVTARLESQANDLNHVRAHFAASRAPEPGEFRRYLENLGFSVRNPGVQAVGFAPLTADGQAPVTLVEPRDWQNRRAIGLNLLESEEARRAFLHARRGGGVVLAGPHPLRPGGDPELLLLVPQMDRGEARGVFFTSFRASDFFNQIFGAPSLQREPVNFVLGLAEAGRPWRPLYDRFDVADYEADSWLTVDRPIGLLGRSFVLRTYPLAHFYSFADRYLALIVGLGAALLSCLIMVVMRVSQNQLDFAILAKEASMEAAKQSRLQIENLRRLNKFDQSLAGELDVDTLVRKFVAAMDQLAPVDASFLFFAKNHARLSAPLPLVNAVGVDDADLKLKSIPAHWLERLFSHSLHLRKDGPAAEEVLGSLLARTEIYSDWILAAVGTREMGRCGLVFLARKNDGRFSEVDHELFESTISQFSASVEIAQLFSRVEDASKAKNAFLANMSHEIRTPLSAIIGFSDMISRERVSGEQRAEILQNIRKNGEQLTCIIDDILDLSKVEAGKLRIETRRVRLGSVLHEVRSVMEPRAHAKDIGFSVETVGLLPSHIYTDEVRLKQILMNLVGNSIKFTETGAVRLIVRLPKPEARDPVLIFTIKDTGIGISDEAQAELFRPFSQGDASTTRRYGGSGLGLALSKRLAQQLGGDIALVESIRGQGSTFELRVSVGDLSLASWSNRLLTPVALVTKEKTAPPALDGLKILVVEDSEDNQEIFKYFLESSGAKAEVVSNGIQAVKSAGGGNYDMILMDIQIPGIDGKEATRRIRQQGFARPIVALTAHAMAEEQESCMRAGCNGQITKPVSGEALVSQVAEFAGRV